MASYYAEQKKVNIIINRVVQQARINKTTIDIKKLCFDLTNQFEISEKNIIKRLKLISELEKEFKVVDMEAFWE